MVQFNHAILMVPLEHDSIWLECTSQRLPPGYLGSFTDDRTVLFVTEEGGQLGRTPVYTMQENCVTTNAEVKIHSDLSASIVRDRVFGGLFFEDMYNEILYLDQVDQRRKIMQELDLSGFVLKSFAYDFTTASPVTVDQHVEIEDDDFLTPSGDYIMLQLNRVNSKISLPTRVRDRKQELYIRRPGMFVDTVTYILPEGLRAEHLPEPCHITSEFGTYISEVQQAGNKMLFIRRIETWNGLFPPGKYQDFYAYYKEIVRSDGQQVVLKLH